MCGSGNAHPNGQCLVENKLAGAPQEAMSELFVCQICLDIVYKPIVLQACGHVFCFWCLCRAMNEMKPSQCPACRQTYLHFPRVCRLLHFVVGKLWPVDYERKESETRAMEQASEISSPNVFPLLSTTPHSSSRINHRSPSTVMNPKLHVYPEHYVEDGSNITKNKEEGITMEDAVCRACRKLLYRPVVLNCGEVLCESCCIMERQDVPEAVSGSTPVTPVGCCSECGTLHPRSGPVAVCLPLHQLLEYMFPSHYAHRRDETNHLLSSATTPSPGKLSEEKEDDKKDDNGFVHVGTGCDGCGMFPILGRHRYHCLDCSERVGYDLCQRCYQNISLHACCSSSYGNSPASVLSGRFSQQHSAEHRMVEMVSTQRACPATYFNTIIRLLRLNAAPVDFDLHNATLQSRRRTRQQILEDFDDYIDRLM